jgi:hypothetical protein
MAHFEAISTKFPMENHIHRSRGRPTFNGLDSQHSYGLNQERTTRDPQQQLEIQIRTLEQSLLDEVAGHNATRIRLNWEMQQRLATERALNDTSLAYKASYDMVGQLRTTVAERDAQVAFFRNKLDEESKVR